MAGQEAVARKRRTRGTLDRDTVVTKALELIDRDGLESLSMQRLAKALEAGEMTIYGYVRSRQELLEAIVEHLLEDAPHIDEDGARPWQERLLEYVYAARRHSLQHPNLVTLFLNNTLNAQVGIDQGLALLRFLLNAGFDRDTAPKALVALTTAVNGFVAWEVPRFHLQSAEEYRRVIGAGIARMQQAPELLAFQLRDALTGTPAEEQFAFAMQMVLRGLEDLLSNQRSPEDQP